MFPEYTVGNKSLNYVTLLRGVISLVFGILLLTHTRESVDVLILLLGLWCLIKGLFGILSTFVDDTRWGWKLLGGMLGVLAGLLVSSFRLPGGMIFFFLIIILGVLGVIYGVVALVIAF